MGMAELRRDVAGRNAGAERYYMVAKQVWRTSGGAELGLCPRVGLVHELDLRWGTGVESAARGRLSLGHTNGRHPRVKGRTLLGPKHFPPTVILETEQKDSCGASPRVASTHLLCFQAGRSTFRSHREAARVGARGGMRSVFPKGCT